MGRRRRDDEQHHIEPVTEFIVDAEAFERFLARLQRPDEPNPRLAKLFAQLKPRLDD